MTLTPFNTNYICPKMVENDEIKDINISHINQTVKKI